MNILFILSLILIIVNVFRGWHRGIIGMIYGVCTWVFIGVFVLLINPVLYNYMMNDEGIHDGVYEKVYPYVDRRVPGYTDEETGYVTNTIRLSSNVEIPEDILEKIESGEIEIPDEYKEQYEEIIENGDLSQYKDIIDNIDMNTVREFLGDDSNSDDIEEIIEDVKENVEENALDIRTGIVEVAAEKATGYVIKFMAVVIAYAIAKIIAIIVKIILDTFFDKGIIGQIMHFAGAAFGAVESVFYIWIIMYGISLILVLDFGQTLYGYVQENPMLKLLYENNALEYFLSHL